MFPSCPSPRLTIERQKIDGSSREVFLEKGLDSCQGLAIDWMGRNIYWTDEGRGAISVARLDDATKRRMLISVPHPRSIAIDPKRGFMYWSQWEFVVQVLEHTSTQATIQRSWMDGTHAEIFVADNLHWPNGLVIDYTGKKIYWCDVHLGRIERIGLDGSGREVTSQMMLCPTKSNVSLTVGEIRIGKSSESLQLGPVRQLLVLDRKRSGKNSKNVVDQRIAAHRDDANRKTHSFRYQTVRQFFTNR